MRNLILTGAITFAFVVVAAGYYLASPEPRVDIRKFVGDPINIEGKVITLHGVFDAPGDLPRDLSGARDFSFQVDDSTGFKKAELRWPAWEELAAQGTSGRFNIDELPRTEASGSLEDLRSSLGKGDIYVEADFPASIHKSRNPVASLVFYQVMVIPPPPLP